MGLHIVGQIDALRLAPGDRVVITIPGFVPSDYVPRLEEQVKAMFPDHPCVVLTDGAQLDIVRETDPTDGRP